MKLFCSIVFKLVSPLMLWRLNKRFCRFVAQTENIQFWTKWNRFDWCFRFKDLIEFIFELRFFHSAWNEKTQLFLWPAMLLSLAAVTNPMAIRSLALCVMIKTIFWIGVQNALLILGVLNVSESLWNFPILVLVRDQFQVVIRRLFRFVQQIVASNCTSF